GSWRLLGMMGRTGVILLDKVEAARGQVRGTWNAVIEAATSGFSHHVDSDIPGSRPDPDRAHHILGADGLRDHGGLAGGNAADAAVPPRALCCLVPRQGAGRRRARLTPTICRPRLDASPLASEHRSALSYGR